MVQKLRWSLPHRFLYMDSQDSTEDDQYEAYKAKFLKVGDGKTCFIVVRTMDIGGDKELPY